MFGARTFDRHIGIDYSGAETAESSLKGLRVYLSEDSGEPLEVRYSDACGPSPRWYWSRREIAHWLADRLAEEKPTLVGIDHGFSFPIEYFKHHHLPLDWECFLMDFQWHWPTDEPFTYVDFVRDAVVGNGAARTGNRRWRRLTEMRSRGAKSVFHFDCQGTVAKSTHAGLPWLLYLRRKLGDRIHFWPFDGWEVPAGKSVLAEVYPALWNKRFPTSDRDPHQQDAYAVAAWMRESDQDGSLAGFFHPKLDDLELKIATIEGWILGIP